jgi:hypothetical protein
MKNLNLFAAIFWFVVGVAILATPQDLLVIRLGGVQFSSGWLAFVLVLYNLVRWWSLRSYRQQRQAEQQALAKREERHREERREQVEPDPNFNFTDPPPSPGGGPRPG